MTYKSCDDDILATMYIWAKLPRRPLFAGSHAIYNPFNCSKYKLLQNPLKACITSLYHMMLELMLCCLFNFLPVVCCILCIFLFIKGQMLPQQAASLGQRMYVPCLSLPTASGVPEKQSKTDNACIIIYSAWCVCRYLIAMTKLP